MTRLRPSLRNDTAWRRFLNGPLPWLAYLPFYSVPWFWVRPTRADVTASLIGLVLFLPLYLSRSRTAGWGLFTAACLVMVIAVALAPWGGNWTVFAIYAGSMAGGLRPGRFAGWTIFGFAVLTVVVGLTMSHPLIWWLPGVLLIGTTGFGVMSREAVLDRNDALLAAQEEVRRLSQTAERERITRDLHDVVGRTLTLVALKSDIAARLAIDDPLAAAAEMRSVAGAAREGLGELREAITNVIRHAGARHCRMAISTFDGLARLTIEDDGRGGTFAEGTGLRGMRQRLTAAGGSLRLENSAPGTRLAAAVPTGVA
ncbi:sensor histidine kinase [Sphingomonas sp. UYP23]